MKKFLSIVLVFLLVFGFITAVIYTYEKLKRENDTQDVLESERITAKDAEKLCYTIMGDKDESTGFTFSFGATDTFEKDGKEYYAIRASWLVNNTHMSYIGDFFVSVDGKEVYTGFVQDDEFIFEELIWSK